ncbi:MAG: hypothetical protein K0R54_765 [Clostridiaceae bacterium]|jgi:hypothetical protein|nr:hypothetical protein [Clostridiaceae bacterium]
MDYKNAKKLHNNDEIIVKETGEVTKVITTETYDKDVYVYAVTNDNGYTKLHHKEIN